MKILVTGAHGMLGRDLTAVLRAAGHPVVALGRRDLDVTDPDAVRAALDGHTPHTVVNCAAHTAVDRAESEPAAARLAHLVNAEGPRLLALECLARDSRLLHFSTDYVFSGNAVVPYPEDAPTGPGTVYGRTKLLGERAVLETLPRTGCVLRCAWLYGAHGPNFVTTMMRLAARRGTVDVVDDQYGQPTWTVDVARATMSLLSRPALAGVFHLTNSGEITWHGLAREVFTLLGTDPDRVRPVTTAALGRPAARPARSTLAHHRQAAAGLGTPRHWRTALHAAFPTLHP